MSELKLSGKITGIGEEVNGVSKSGKDWSKVDFVIETDDTYPKSVCFTLFGDNCTAISDKEVGEMVTVSFNVDSREFNGRWYTNATAFLVE